ncbi:MepB family protein [Flavobacterium psychrotrophum]|uniref:MepB family protein n=1 Tax=Flavobacterium psychrotrophum TaxID=2294119 RepID=UPI000E3199EE|nr:MepB family protein [Flavobacterium psychrotrophum]
MSSNDKLGLQVLEDLGLGISDFTTDKESADYNAASFSLNGLNILYRSAKITPTKNGQFVTLWKRIKNGTIQPFDNNDAVDCVVVAVQKDGQSGHFIFSADILFQQKIFSKDNVEGKRAFRVYPPWDVPQSKQAAKTQKWQLDFYIEIKDGMYTNPVKVKSLLGL